MRALGLIPVLTHTEEADANWRNAIAKSLKEVAQIGWVDRESLGQISVSVSEGNKGIISMAGGFKPLTGNPKPASSKPTGHALTAGELEAAPAERPLAWHYIL